MTNTKKALQFVPDYTGLGRDRFYLCSDSGVVEVSNRDVMGERVEFVCHDFWLMSPALFGQQGELSGCITDVDELRICTSGNKVERRERERSDISKFLASYADQEVLKQYAGIVTRGEAVNVDVMREVGQALIRYADSLEKEAKSKNEWERYLQIERPVSQYLAKSAASGISIDTEKLRAHKDTMEFDYYMALKRFSAKYNMPLEVPSDEDVVKYLAPKGFDFTGVGVDYVLTFVPMEEEFAVDLVRLRKLAKSRKVLAALPLSQSRIYPIVDCFGSITSRIYFKDPSLQNLAKKHRDILIPEHAKVFSYVDYGQYEVGIMAALSGDGELMKLYAEEDMYEAAGAHIFQQAGRRKEAKRLFLSYAYGMRRKNLIDAAAAYGASRESAKEFFGRFAQFENWKQSVWERFVSEGKIGTDLGNYLCRNRSGELTEKEKRSAVSQVVQGTASLIFKKVLIAVRSESGVSVKVPMHDALLFEHSRDFNPSTIVGFFSDVMTNHFSGVIKGKASLDAFHGA